MIDSRAKGARGEREFIATYLIAHWPEAKRNLDQFGLDKRDCITVAGIHWQIKRTERLNVWAAYQQARTEAEGYDVPVVAFRRNRSPWLCLIEAGELIPLLRLRDA